MRHRESRAFAIASFLCLVGLGAEIVEVPYPDPAPKFDCTKIDRDLKEPEYGSETPAYRFLALGPAGETIIAMVADESQGTGLGIDTLYMDLNANHDLTEPTERFALKSAKKMKKRRERDGLVTLSISDWGVAVVSKRKLEVPDPKLEYQLYVGHSFLRIETNSKGKDWGFPMRVMDAAAPWSISRDKAPVYRFGGNEITFANEHFIRRPGVRAKPGASPARVAKPGDNIFIDGTAPFYLGSSPEVGLGKGRGVYCPWTARNLQARIEVGDGGDRRVFEVPFNSSCGGAFWGSILVSSAYPPGDAALILSMDTKSHAGLFVQRIPFKVENPLYGKPIEDPEVVRQLREKHQDATVLDLYRGVALEEFGIPAYDGVRDVYFGDGRGLNFGGSCQNRGVGLSYGTELRYRLDLGGESRRTLIKYDLSMLPPDTKVQAATLSLHVVGLSRKEPFTCQAVALKKRWSEKVISVMGGLNSTNSPTPRRGRKLYPVGNMENWDEPMFMGEGDRHPEPVAEVALKGKGWSTLDVTEAVQNWVSGKWENHGLGLELPDIPRKYGAKDVWMTASDYAPNPGLRPRLTLVLAEKPTPSPYTVKQENTDLEAAAEQAESSSRRCA